MIIYVITESRGVLFQLRYKGRSIELEYELIPFRVHMTLDYLGLPGYRSGDVSPFLEDKQSVQIIDC